VIVVLAHGAFTDPSPWSRVAAQPISRLTTVGVLRRPAL
jgi:hypothetical protein